VALPLSEFFLLGDTHPGRFVVRGALGFGEKAAVERGNVLRLVVEGNVEALAVGCQRFVGGLLVVQVVGMRGSDGLHHRDRGCG